MSYPKANYSASKDQYRSTEQTKKRDHIRSLLSNKFRLKYISNRSTAQDEKIIAREVDTFVKHNIMSEANLVVLDKTLAGLLNKPFKTNTKTPSLPSRRSQGHRSVLSSDSIHQSVEKNTSKISQMGERMILKDEWTKLVDHDYEMYCQELDQQKTDNRNNTIRLQADLRVQVDDRKKKLEEDRKTDEFYIKMQRNNIIQENIKAKQKDSELKNKIIYEKKVRDEMLEETIKQKQTDIAKERALDIEQKQRIIKEIQDQEYHERAKREQYKVVCQKQIKENEKLKEIQREKERKEAQIKVRGHDLLGKLFEEKKHISYIKMEKQDQFMERIKGRFQSVGRTRDDKAYDIYAQQIERDYIQLEEQRKIRTDTQIQNTQQTLQQQVYEKTRRERLQKEMDKLEADQINKGAQKEMDKEMEKKYLGQKMFIQHKDTLLQQIKERRDKQSKGMQPEEFLMNKSMLNKIDAINFSR